MVLYSLGVHMKVFVFVFELPYKGRSSLKKILKTYVFWIFVNKMEMGLNVEVNASQNFCSIYPFRDFKMKNLNI